MAGKADRFHDIGLLILRIGLGLVVLYYGSYKALGLFGGPGFQGQLNQWEIQRGIPQWLGVLAVVSEFAGSIGILFGLLTRVAALGVACTMATAAYFGASAPGAMEALLQGNLQTVSRFGYPGSLMVMAIVLVFTGAGGISMDRRLFKRGG